MTERLRFRIPAGAAGKFSSAKLTLCADILGVQWHVKDPGYSAKGQVAGYIYKHAYNLDPAKSEWADCAAVQAYKKRAHTQLVRDHSATVVLAS